MKHKNDEKTKTKKTEIIILNFQKKKNEIPKNQISKFGFPPKFQISKFPNFQISGRQVGRPAGLFLPQITKIIPKTL